MRSTVQAFGASCVADLPTVLASVGWAAATGLHLAKGDVVDIAS